MTRDYDALALSYARDVVEGREVACKWVVAACARQLADLSRQSTSEFPFRYEPARGARVCAMISLFPHVKGRWASATITLERWQVFILMTVFSWVWSTCGSVEPAYAAKDGLRRFRSVYIEVARKNAKSTLTAGVANYMLTADGEDGAECYSTATTRDQARIVFDVSRSMAKRSPQFCRTFGVEVLAHALLVPASESVFKALSSEDDSLDGLNPHFAGVDELHAHRTRGVYDVLETATGARDQSILWVITTSGSNRAGICYEVRGYVCQILTHVLHGEDTLCEARGYRVDGAHATDETFFGMIFTIDDGDDWTDRSCWKKANPNLGVSVKLDDLERKARKAEQVPSAVPNFLTKHLDVWINADSPWMDMRRWDLCADPRLTITDFAGAECFTAVDLASNIDIAAVVHLFSRQLPEVTKSGETELKTHYYAFGRFYVPEATVESSDNAEYAGWEQEGHLIATEGDVIDQNAIQDDLRAHKSDFTLRELAYDPFQATKFASELTEEGFPCTEFGATVKNFSAPMKEVDAAVRAGRFHHDGSPVMTWMVSNVVGHLDKKDNIFPTKNTVDKKIDGAVALIMAMGRAMHAPAPDVSIYETQDGIATT